MYFGEENFLDVYFFRRMCTCLDGCVHLSTDVYICRQMCTKRHQSVEMCINSGVVHIRRHKSTLCIHNRPVGYTHPQHQKVTNQPRCVYTSIRLGIPIRLMCIHRISNEYTQPACCSGYTSVQSVYTARPTSIYKVQGLYPPGIEGLSRDVRIFRRQFNHYG